MINFDLIRTGEDARKQLLLIAENNFKERANELIRHVKLWSDQECLAFFQTEPTSTPTTTPEDLGSESDEEIIECFENGLSNENTDKALPRPSTPANVSLSDMGMYRPPNTEPQANEQKTKPRLGPRAYNTIFDLPGKNYYQSPAINLSAITNTRPKKY